MVLNLDPSGGISESSGYGWLTGSPACYFKVTPTDWQWAPNKHNIYGSWWEPTKLARSGLLPWDRPPHYWRWEWDPATSECGWILNLHSREEHPSQLKLWPPAAFWKSPTANPKDTFPLTEFRALKPGSSVVLCSNSSWLPQSRIICRVC